MLSLQQRQREGARRVAEFLHMDVEEVLLHIPWACERQAAAWRERNAQTPEETEAFYGAWNPDFLYDLLGWNSTPLYQSIAAQLDSIINSRVLVIGPGLGTEVEILLSKGNRVTMLELHGTLHDFQAWRFGAVAAHTSWEKLAKIPNLYDDVVAIDSLEHIHPDALRGCLLSVWRALRVDGKLVVHCPPAARDLPQHYDCNVEAVNRWLKVYFTPTTQSEYVWVRA